MSASSSSFRIRHESAADVAGVRALTEAAFTASKYGHHGESRLVDRLRENCLECLALVAESDGRLVGHVLFSPVAIAHGDQKCGGMGLGPVSVHPDFQRQGCGARLIETGLQQLRSQGVPFVIVLGDPAYYGRFGFVSATRCGVTCEFDGLPEGAFQLLPLAVDAAAIPSGIAKYRREFSEL